MTTVSTRDERRLTKSTPAAALMASMRLSFATASYKTWQPWMGLPIRTSVGAPRNIRYQLAGAEPRLAPDRSWLHLDRDEYEPLYLDRLHNIGPYPMLSINDIAYTLACKAGMPDGARIVWLCFEDLSKPDAWCHRRMLADWLEAAGIPCPELTPKETQ